MPCYVMLCDRNPMAAVGGQKVLGSADTKCFMRC